MQLVGLLGFGVVSEEFADLSNESSVLTDRDILKLSLELKLMF